jgi:cation:H+ antiporter
MVMAMVGIVLGLLLLSGGAEFLVRGSSALALRMGVSSLLVGLTVVAFGTSAPEMVVSLQAGAAGMGGIALGNVIGST